MEYVSAEVAMWRWASVGGLKDESRMRRVDGGWLDGGFGIEYTTRKVSFDWEKSFSMFDTLGRVCRISSWLIDIFGVFYDLVVVADAVSIDDVNQL